jgi:hypothetical protein
VTLLSGGGTAQLIIPPLPSPANTGYTTTDPASQCATFTPKRHDPIRWSALRTVVGSQRCVVGGGRERQGWRPLRCRKLNAGRQPPNPRRYFILIIIFFCLLPRAHMQPRTKELARCIAEPPSRRRGTLKPTDSRQPYLDQRNLPLPTLACQH